LFAHAIKVGTREWGGDAGGSVAFAGNDNERTTMQLEGLHHVTAITADAQRSVDFYAGLLGLLMVKKTVNFDQPDVYHLYYGDERGAPGSILTFFEFPGAAVGRAGTGMVHTIRWRVGDAATLDFWTSRLEGAGIAVDRLTASLGFADFEGLRHEFLIDTETDPPLVAHADDVPTGHALRGLDGVRAYATAAPASASLLEALGFSASGENTWLAAGDQRRASIAYDAPPTDGMSGAGTVHHVAWSAADDAQLDAFRDRAAGAGARPTPIIDRQYFHSVYFREPSGVLFELATRDIGFDIDEPLDSLGRALALPPQYESRRGDLERRLTPLRDPRATVSS